MQSLWMLFASFLFAAMGVFVKLASEVYSTSEIVMYRGIVGVVLLLALIRLQNGTLRTRFATGHLWRSVIGVISLWMWFFSIARLPLATAMTLNYLSPIWIAVWLFAHGWWHARNRVEWPLIGAVTMSFVGVILLLQPAFHANQLFYALVAIGSSLLTAVAYMQVRKLGLQGEPEYRVVFYFACSNVVAGLLGNVAESGGAPVFHSLADGHGFLLLLGIGVFATAAQITMTRAYRLGSTLVVANLQYTGIVFSSFWGVLVFADDFGWLGWLGIAIILVSGSAATFYNTRSTERGKAVAATDPIASEV